MPLYRCPSIYLCLCFLFTLLLAASDAQATPPVPIRVNISIHHQRMDGFGVSGCWWPTQTSNWPPGLLDKALDQLFTDAGADLSIYRYYIGAGGGNEIRNPSRRGINVEISPGKYDLSRDAAGMRVLHGVRNRGVKQFIAISISPPVRLTRNGLASGGDDGGPNLRPGAEGELAKYLVDISDLLRIDLQLPRIGLSPINEPQWKWGQEKRTQEGCHYSPVQAAAITRAVLHEVERRKLPIDVQSPELGRWGHESPQYVRALRGDDYIRSRLNALAVHSYFSQPPDKLSLARLIHSFSPKLKVVMSEYCLMQGGRHLDMRSALQTAKIIHNDLTIGNAAAWEWWLGVSSYNFGDGLIYFNRDQQTLTVSKRLYVLGQYSRFVRPGFTRVDASAADSKLSVTAFTSGDHQELSVVITNPTWSAIPISLQLAGASSHSMRAFVTDATRSVAELPEDQTRVVPPESVVTLICKLQK